MNVELGSEGGTGKGTKNLHKGPVVDGGKVAGMTEGRPVRPQGGRGGGTEALLG